MPQRKASTRSARGKQTRTKARSARSGPGGEITGLDKSIESFRHSLERSLTLSRDRVQEVVDDAVRRGRITRGDAENLVSDLVSRGRTQTDRMLKDLERLASQARREIQGRTSPARKQAGRAARRARREVGTQAGRVGRAARDVADRPLARADQLRRRAGVSGTFPITAYDQLTSVQIRARLGHLTPAELRKVRDYEQRNAKRKGVIAAIERKLA